MEAPSDSTLMERYARGSPAAFEELFRRYERRAWSYFVARTGSPEQAQDLYQELFLRLHRFRGRFDASRPFAPWFFRIAQRVWIDHLRRLAGERAPGLDPEQVAASPVDDPERRALARSEVSRILAGVSREQARVVVAAKLGGFEYGEIARELGRTVAAVKQIGARALRGMRRDSSRGREGGAAGWNGNDR